MFRRLLPLLLLAPLAASCKPPEILVHAAFVHGRLAFVAPDGDQALLCWSEGIVVDDGLKPVWRFTGPRTGSCRSAFPLYYGRAPEGAATAIAAAPLEPGRLYLFVGDATAQISGAFALSRAGKGMMVHNVDPDSPLAAALRGRWWRLPPHPAPAAGAARWP